MKPRTLEYKKALIQECILDGRETVNTLYEEFRKLRTQLGEGSGEEVSGMLEAPAEEAMNEWLEKTVNKLNPIIGNRKWPDIFGKNCTSIDDYIDKLHILERTIDEQEGEEEEKLLLIDISNSKVINLKNNQAVELAGTDYWSYLKILVEAEGDKVMYADIVDRFPYKRHMGTHAKICGTFKRNLLKKLLETGLLKEDVDKIIIAQNSHQLNLKYVEIR